MFEPVPSGQDSSVALIGRVTGGAVRFRSAAIDIYTAEQSDCLQINFDGARQTTPKGVDREQSQTNYLIGDNPALWRTHVSNYAKVLYSGLYHGVDAVFYGNGNHLEHDFIVKPGADYRQIRMHFPAKTQVQIEEDGALAMNFAGALLRMQAPTIYQNVNGKKLQRHGTFQVLPNGDIGFAVASYDPRFDLVIDPVIDFSTYLSPSASDGLAIAADANGNSYVTGYGALGYPVTPGAFPGCATCTTNGVVTFVSKLSPDGSKLIYSTVLGGNDFAQPTGIAVDANGHAIVSGWTGASDFPTKSGQPILAPAGHYIGFLVSMSSDGSSLNYGTLLGPAPASTGAGMTYAKAVAVDGSGNAYVTGETGEGFFVSNGALNQEAQGLTSYNQFNVYLAKFDPTGTLLYSAVLGTADPQNGGGGPIGATAVAVDATGNAYVTGQAGTLWPITNGAYLNQIAGPMPFATPFVMKVAADAKSVVYSTYLNYAYLMSGISVLPNGNAFVVGNGAGPDYPTTSNAYEPNDGSSTSFLTELNANGTALVYSTMLCGGSCNVNGMAIDPDGNIWLAAQTGNTQFPFVKPLQSILPSTFSTGLVSALAEFDPTGQTLEFSTFLGGLAQGYASSVAIDPNRKVHVSGAAEYGMYTTAGVYAGSVPAPGPGYASATFAYVALVDPTVPAAGLCASPNSELSLSAPVGAPFETTLTVTSCGALPLTITGAATSSGDFSVPASENGCIQTLPVGQSCTLSVRFIPTAAGSESSALTISSNSPIPAVLPLSGFGTTAPVITLSATSLTFGPQLLGTESAPQTITLTNTGNATLNGIGFGMLAAYGPVFPLTFNCGSFLAPGNSCQCAVSFKPASTGTTTTTLLVENGSGLPLQGVSLSGTSPQSSGSGTTTPAITLSATSLSFASQLVGTESAPQTITLTNTGNATLNGIGFGIPAAYGPVFPLTFNCAPSLAPGDSCQFGVSFKPASTGTTATTLSVENSSGLPVQQVSLSGTSPQSAFVVGTQAGGSMSSTVMAGNTATYMLAITPTGGYSGNLNLSCSKLPTNASCTFTPASLALTGDNPTNFTLSISTELTQTASLLRRGELGLALAALFLMPFRRNRKRATALICFGVLVLTTAISACGSSSKAAGSTTAKVSPGTYTIHVSASDASKNQTTQSVTLIVQ